MQTAIFIYPTLTGHLNPTLLLAKYLHKQGIRVLYAGAYDLEAFVQQHGFEFYLLRSSPFAVGTEQYMHKGKQEGWLENIIDRFSDKHYQARKKDLELMLKALNPDWLFLDDFCFSDFVLLYPHLNPERKLVFLLSKLPLQQDAKTPPLNTPYLPHEKNITWLWQRFFLKRAFRHLGEFCKNLGYDNLSMLESKFKAQQIPERFRIFRNKVFQPSFENVAEWIFVPAEMDFPDRKLLPWQDFVGLMVDLNRSEHLNEEYKACIEEAKNYEKLIYCSLGTVLNTHQERGKLNLKAFFENLFAVFAQNPNWFLVLSLEENFSKTLENIPPNVRIFSQVPQIDQLKHCDLFLTHGGMNSILESTTLGVPMLVFPLNQQWDQNGNAARVVFHGLGLLGNIKNSQAKQMREQIETLLNNPDFKTNAQRMSTAFKEKYSDEQFLEEFWKKERN